ncbi:P-loop containing nucleoside triphosphate hydrolase protein [Pterulicium gracile]|uniref:P-loop containing nucleoside triphosphate hydrolase protein n=1 Tax=Pterulicium gracile TaxID=1884261 RepID=A0A5C3QZ97_9AGAR|nr:P-loop containing nucleoside triphosphate hydrolase protein [Pterula gracilis]
MDSVARTLALELVNRLEGSSPDSRILVAIAGLPASGKTTLCISLLHHTNAILTERNLSEQAIVVGQDGWHLSRAQLAALPDPQLATERRGIHWTFDAPSYLSFLQSLRLPLSPDAQRITAPAFDHAVKDPSYDALTILPAHRIVIIEGLYVFLNLEIWKDAAVLMDERWLLSVDNDEARRRLIKRHVVTGICRDAAEAQWRADENDLPNGAFVLENMFSPTRVIESTDGLQEIAG